MTPAISPPAPVVVGGTDSSASAVSQNLFEHAAQNAQGSLGGASPADAGSVVFDKLQGFVERSNRFNESLGASKTGAENSPDGLKPFNASALSSEAGSASSTDGSKIRDSDMDRMMDTLSRTFDYAFETHLISNGVTQLAGGVKSLLRGQ